MKNKYILILDDDDFFLKSVERVLKFNGFNLLTASTCKQAFELCSIYDFCVIISDYKMPDMNGLEFLQKIKQLYPHVVLIMLTAVSDVNIAIDAINDIGIFKFILKPINYKILEDSINSAISHNYDNNNEKNINDVIRSKDSVLRDLERQYPGISSMPPRDKDGYILLEI